MFAFLKQDEKVQLCGSAQPSSRYFMSDDIYVSFKADNSINGAGFSFKYTKIGKLKITTAQRQGYISRPGLYY